ncbi:MAG: PAS domain S-box protein [Bacteroidales bacterium]|nr:PAS domain S-box protein [Bacteroidales bacterium]
MSLSTNNEKHLEENDLQSDLNHLGSGHHKDKPDKKFLLGTVQFYDRILDSLEDSFIAVFNSSGKHIEVWSDPHFKEVAGVNPFEFKGRLCQEVYDKETAKNIVQWIQNVYESGNKSSHTLPIHFPEKTLWFKLTLKVLPGSDPKISNVVGFFQNNTQNVELKNQLDKQKEKNRKSQQEEFEASLIINHKGMVTSVNQALLDLSGYGKSDFVGFKINRLPVLPQNYHISIQRLFDLTKTGENPQSIELKWQNSSNQTLWSEVFARTVQRKDNPVYVKFYFKDISDKKFVEKDLVKSKQAYKIIIENTSEAIFILQDETIKFSNSQLLDLMDYSLDDLIKTPFTEFLHPDDRGIFKQLSGDRLYEVNGKNTDTVRLLKKDKSFKWLRAKSVYIEWESRPASLFYFVDITQEKINEEAINKVVAEYKLITDKAIDFATLTNDSEIFRFTGKRLIEIPSITAVLIISYDPETNTPKVEIIEGSADAIANLEAVIRNNNAEFPDKINHELIRNISYGKLIKYNDGLFDQGYNIFPKSTFNVIQKILHVSGIYLLGFTHGNTVFGTALIFTPENKKLEHSGVIETIARLASASLKRRETTLELKRREQNYRRIFESYQDVYFRTDMDGVILQVSPSIKSILGFEAKDVEGKMINYFFHDQAKIAAYTKELIRENILSDRDIKLVNKNKELVYASLSAVLVRDENSGPTGFEGFIRNISERKKAEELYQKSELKFRTLADFTYDWEYWLSPEGEVIYMSPSCQRISGYSADEFSNDPELLNQIVIDEDRPLPLLDKIRERLLNEKDNVITADLRIRTRENKIKWISHTIQLLNNEEDEFLGYRISNRDITEQKLADEELRNSEQRFRTLFIDNPDAVIVEDYHGNILSVNPAACALIQAGEAEILNQNITSFVPRDITNEISGQLSKWINGEIKNIRSYLQTKKGVKIPVEIHGNKINFSGNEALLFIIRDFTEVTEKERKLKESVEKAEESDMLKSAFLANVSHEIRTPMNAIIGFSEILTNPDLSQKERNEFIQYITQGSNTLMTLIEDIIDITKIEAGQLKIDFDECNVDDLLDELYATFIKMKNKTGKADVELRMKKPTVEKGFIISTDPHRIRQILSNLLGNALKFTNKGFIEFGFNLRGPDDIVFYVQDTGIGIPESKQELIFTRFGQVENANKKEHKGTGLGLSISKKLAELLGGKLSVTSKSGKGSTFYLTLPVNKEMQIQKELGKVPQNKPVTWENKLFLIAEDSILNYTFLEALFQKTKVKLLWAKNGREAVEICTENPDIDLVLMDIKMPILGGLEAIAEIKKFRSDLPIIVQTAYAMPEDRERSLAAGGDEHLNKPINPGELFSTISRFLK